MHQILIGFLSLTVALLVACVAACSTTPEHALENEWTDPEWRGDSLGVVLVVGIYEDRALRITWEGMFSQGLRENGIEALESFDIIPDLKSLDEEEEVRAALSGRGFDTALTSALIDSDEEIDLDTWKAQHAPMRIGGSTALLQRLEGTERFQAASRYVLDIGLWDTETLQLFWNATSGSYSQEDIAGGATDFASFLAQQLRGRGLL